MATDRTVSQTAVEAWDKRWATSQGHADWLDPHPAVAAILPELHARGASRVLDLGCGVGRHALLLAKHGFDVEAIDGSLAGLAVARETAAGCGLPVSLHEGFADALPFPAEFDYQVERKGHPHCYCDAATLVGLLAGFDLLTLSQQLQERRPGSHHWHIIAERCG